MKHPEMLGSILFKQYIIPIIFIVFFYLGSAIAEEQSILRISEEGFQDVDLEYLISWQAPAHVFGVLSIYYMKETENTPKKLIVSKLPLSQERKSYLWNTATVPEGNYYLWGKVKTNKKTYTYQTKNTIKINHRKTCLDLNLAENLIANNGFEKGLFKPKNWSVIVPNKERERDWSTAWSRDSENVHSGKRSLEIANVYNGVNSDSAWEDRVIVQSEINDFGPNEGAFVFSAWMKTLGIEFGEVIFKIKYYNDKSEPLNMKGYKWDSLYVDIPSNGNWHRESFLVFPPHWDKSEKRMASSLPSKFSISISLDHSAGTIYVDDLHLSAITLEDYKTHSPIYNFLRPTITTSKKKPSFKSQYGKEFRVENKSGVWWLVAPGKGAFWSQGVNFSPNPFVLENADISKRNYVRASQFRQTDELYFNQGWRKKNGSNNYSSLYNNIVWMNFSSEADIEEDASKWVAKDRDGKYIAEYGHYFPDVFSPIWQDYAEKHANSLLNDGGWAIESKNTIGYWTDNEWAYGDLHDFIWGDASTLAFIDWLKGDNHLPSLEKLYKAKGINQKVKVPQGFEIKNSYTDINELNKAWTSDFHSYKYQSFNEIKKRDRPYVRGHSDPVQSDLFAFERLLYKIYVDTVIGNIRRVEKSFSIQKKERHKNLIFSNRFSVESMSALTELKRNMDLFEDFDVIAVNLYPNYNQLAVYYPYPYLKKIEDTFYKSTNKPLYISEFGLAAEDANSCVKKPCMGVRRWRPNTVQNQYQRGWGYANIVSTFANLPYVIGANWFKWTDGYGKPLGSDVRNSGLVKDDDTFYSPMTDMVRSVNSEMQKIDRKSSFVLEDIDWSVTKINICK
ncbi:MAG: hypothetical protein OCC45_09455 [Desulfotalea sp.]